MITRDITQHSESPFLGMSDKEVKRYSLARALSGLMNHSRLNDGIEGEMHQELKRRKIGGSHVEGFGVPFDVLLPQRTRAAGDLQVGVYGAGGALVPTDIDDQMVTLLKNKTSAVRLGATVVSGLSGNLVLPRQTSTTLPGRVQETQSAGQSTPALDQISMIPNRVSVEMDYSRQLALTSAVSIESWLRSDISENMAITVDSYALVGGGMSQPSGIMSQAGTSVVNFGGTVAWEKILEFEADLANNNAEMKGMSLGFITTPNVRKAWKSTAVSLAGAQTVSAKPIWEAIPDDENGDGRVNGTRAVATNQIPLDRVIYGNFKELFIGFWGQGLDLVSDPYTRSKESVVRIVANLFMDVALKHGTSFAISADAGDQ